MIVLSVYHPDNTVRKFNKLFIFVEMIYFLNVSSRPTFSKEFDNQLARRNINEYPRAYLIGKRYQEEKKEEGKPKIEIKEQTVSPLLSKNSQENKPKKTAERIAKQSNVSHQTVKNAEKFANAVDKVAKNTLPKLPPFLFIPGCFNCLLINQCLNLQEIIIMHLLKVLFSLT
jgi:hypothetical protein